MENTALMDGNPYSHSHRVTAYGQGRCSEIFDFRGVSHLCFALKREALALSWPEIWKPIELPLGKSSDLWA